MVPAGVAHVQLGYPSHAECIHNVSPPLLVSSSFTFLPRVTEYQQKLLQCTGKWHRSRRKGNQKQRREPKGPRWATPLGRSTYP